MIIQLFFMGVRWFKFSLAVIRLKFGCDLAEYERKAVIPVPSYPKKTGRTAIKTSWVKEAKSCRQSSY